MPCIVLIPGVLTANALFLADHHARSATPFPMRWAWWFALVSAALLPLTFASAIQPLVEWTLAYPWPAAASLASAAAIFCWQYRPSIQLHFSTGWLAALPFTPRQLALWEAARIARLLILIVPFLGTALSDHPARLGLLLLSLLAGSVFGFGLAGRSRPARSATPTEGLRLPIPGPGRVAIARVPLVWAAARLSGKRMAPWLTATLMLIPGGIGGGRSMLMVAVTVLTLALVWLAAGAWRHLFLLSDWLATTPLSPDAFARLALMRVSLWFFAVLFMLLAVLAALQMPLHGVISFFSTIASCAIACFTTAFRHRFNAVAARRSALTIVMGMSVFVLIAPALWLTLIGLVLVIRELRQVGP